MSDTLGLLFANEAFYLAFATRDLSAMDELWAEGVEVSCVHPGWAPLIGRDAVMRSWAAILSGSGAPRIQPYSARAWRIGDMGYVICFEDLGDACMVASNIFQLRDGGWKMLHHHAGPCAEPPPRPAEPAEPLQ